MMSLLTAAAMPLLRRMDAERAHELAMWALRFGWTGRAPADDARLAGMALVRERADGRFELTDAGVARHASEVLHACP